MQYEFSGKSIHEAVGQALNQRHDNIEKKLYKQVSAWAPPAFWGPWADVVAQFGVSGPNPDTHVTKINVSMTGMGSSPFDYEIKGGDRFISGTAVGFKSASADENITITGNVATQISIRWKNIGLGQRKPNGPDVFIVLLFGVCGFEIPCDVGHFAHSNLSKSKLFRTRKMIRTISLSSQASRDLPSDPARTEGSAQVPIR